MCTALVVGNTIGMGIFMLPASLSPYGLNAIPAWLITAAGSIFIAWVFAGLARTFPDDDGPIAYASRAFGGGVAFTLMWCYWVSTWVTNAVLATGVVGYLSMFFPVLGVNHWFAAVTALSLLWLFVLINLRGVRTAGGVQVLSSVLKLLPLVGIMVLGLWVLFTPPYAASGPRTVDARFPPGSDRRLHAGALRDARGGERGAAGRPRAGSGAHDTARYLYRHTAGGADLILRLAGVDTVDPAGGAQRLQCAVRGCLLPPARLRLRESPGSVRDRERPRLPQRLDAHPRRDYGELCAPRRLSAGTRQGELARGSDARLRGHRPLCQHHDDHQLQRFDGGRLHFPQCRGHRRQPAALSRLRAGGAGAVAARENSAAPRA